MPFSKLPTPLAAALNERGYEAPTAVQAAMLEEGADTRDLIVSAQTGSGKTVAFGIALAAQLLDADGRMSVAAAPQAIVIAPTRELALQVSRELMWLYAKAGARIATCVGGMDASKERRSLNHGAHIVVGTPGRLRDHLERGALDMSAIRAAVLDEADEMLDMGFREDLEQILDATPEGRRTLSVLGDDAEADRGAGEALSARCDADFDRRCRAWPWRYFLSGAGGGPVGYRACGGEPAALSRAGYRDPVLRDA